MEQGFAKKDSGKTVLCTCRPVALTLRILYQSVPQKRCLVCVSTMCSSVGLLVY
jgi:hypothetical protein